MGSLTHRLMKDSEFSFFNSLASILTSPYFVCPHAAENDGEFGFDPPPSIASLSEYVSLSQMYDGSNTRSRLAIQEKWPFQERVELAKSYKLSPCKQGEGSSYSEACKGARPSEDVSSHIVRHGLITPPSFTSPVSNKVPKVVKHSARNGTSARKPPQPQTDAWTTAAAASAPASASASFVSSASESNVKSISNASDRTGKTTTRLRTPVRLLDDKKRKLSLEKNKIAAANCRIKKKKKEHYLETQSRELASHNTILKQRVSEMTQHLQELQSMLQFHVSSSDCCAPPHFQEALGERSSHDNFSTTSPCGDNGSASMEGLRGDLFSPDSSLVPEMEADDLSLPDIPTLEGLSPPWESLLTSLDFEGGIEVTTPESANSMYGTSVGR